METMLKSCISSASYVFSTPGNSLPNKENSESLPCGNVFASLGHSGHFSQVKGGSSKVGSPVYIPCNFPSTPLPCSGTLCRSLSSPSDNCGEMGPSPNGNCESSCPSPATSSVCDLQSVPTFSSSTTCHSLRIKPWPGSSEREGRWVRPLGYAERFMTVAGGWSNMMTAYALWLDSRQPISFETIKYTSQLMFRKMPHLRLCIRNYKRDRWWKEMDVERLDIEEIKTDEDVTSVFESLLKRQYNVEEGPLWFVRYLTSVHGSGLVRDPNFNLNHKYVLIFGFHHNFSDGTTNMNFCNIFLSLLNDVLQNKAIDTREVGRFAFPIHDSLADAKKSYWFLLKLFGTRIYRGLILSYVGYVRNFLRHYPLPTDKNGYTCVLQSELDEITTNRLLKRCKMEGVTLNTAFTAAANIGMYRMILQRDGSVTDTRFDSQQAVNMRRYWPKDKQQNAYGCHISMVDIQIPTTKDDISDFWEYARRIHKLIYHELNVEKRTLKMQPLSEKLWLAVCINSWMTFFGLPSANDSHYCITNMGNVSSTFPGVGEEVNVSKILRSVTCHFMQALCQHTLQTFKGKFYYSLDYYPQKMSVDTARAYGSSLMDTLRTVIHLPN